jgi:acetyl-CoA carboxylase biotin carboxyl carrier protein
VTADGAGWLQTVRRVLEQVASSDVSELELAQRDFRLRLRRRVGARPMAPAAEALDSSVPDGVPILAPFTGVFYRAATPTADPYAREGDWVEAGTTVGLIETMKVFNEVKVEQDGRIERLRAQNGQLVQAGDLLMVLVPGERPEDEGRL